jgi:cytochrome P450
MTTQATTDYDPFSDEAMKDPRTLYAKLRKQGGPVFMPKYNAWALARFADVWAASSGQEENITFTAGQTPEQVLLGGPVPHTFMTMDAPEHRKWRGLIREEYTPEAVKTNADRIRKLTRELLEPLLKKGEMDVYKNLANRVTCINAGYMLGLPPQDAETWRALIDGMLEREVGQIGGGSPKNQQSFGQLFGYFMQYIASLRANPSLAKGHTKTYLEAEIDGRKLSDEELAFYMFSLLITGSETTPISVAGTLYYLNQNPAQKKEVIANPQLVRKAFLETLRYDQPTNMLARKARKDFDINGAHIKTGQGLLYLYASANRDEAEFPNADKYDIHREYKRDLIFGHGGHKCLGMHLGTLMGCTILEELISAISDYTVVEDQCSRLYGEHLNGYGQVTLRWNPATAKLK